MTRTRVALGDALDVLIDHRGKTPKKLGGDWTSSGHRVVSALNVKGSRIDDNHHHYISPAMYASWMKVALKKGDVLLTSEAPTGEVAYVDRDRDWALGQRVFGLRAKAGLLDGRYLFYVLRAGDARHQLMSRATGTTVSGIRQSELVKVELDLPPIGEQRAIAATLGALDDKIESNRRAGALETELAIALLTEGTKRVRVGDVAEVNKGLSYKGSGLNDGSSAHALPLLNLGNFTTTGALRREGLKYYTGDFKSRHRLRGWDLVVANTDLTQSREILGRGFLLADSLNGSLHTHHTSHVRFHSRPDLVLVLWAQLQTPEFRDRAKGYATGTTVTALPAEAILDYEISVPEELEASVTKARALIEYSWHLEAEASQLARLRDALLPELLSGRIRVPEAVELVQDVVDESESA